jgi:hypothetical protein
MRSSSWLVALALYLLFTLVFLQARRTQPPPPAPAPYVLSRVDSSAHVLLQTASFTGVLLAPQEQVDRPTDALPVVLLAEHVLVAEAVLAQCVASGNTRGNELSIQPGRLRPLGAYYRQYRGYRTPDGHTIVWINAFAKTEVTQMRGSRHWQRQEVRVDDGGDAFFNISIDLSTQQCFHFYRNSSA